MRLLKKDIAEITGIKPRRILAWTQFGYLIPPEKAEGQGKISFYSLGNCVEVKILEKLTEKGLSLKKFSSIFHGEVRNKINGLADYLIGPFSEHTNHFNTIEIVYSLVIKGDCEEVQIIHNETNKPLEILTVKNQVPEIGDFYESVIIINLNKIFYELKGEVLPFM